MPTAGIEAIGDGMKRRGFFGFLGGAAAAGPAAIASAAAPAQAHLSDATMWMNYGDANMGVMGSSAMSTANQAARLRRLISGEEKENDPFGEAGNFRLFAQERMETLRSISKASKMRILARELAKIDGEAQKQAWWQQLLGLEARGT